MTINPIATNDIPVPVQIAQALFDSVHPQGRLVSHRESAWCSRSFAGARHAFTIRFDGPDAHRAAQSLVAKVEHDAMPLGDRLVAQIAVTRHIGASTPAPFAEIDIAALTLDSGAPASPRPWPLA